MKFKKMACYGKFQSVLRQFEVAFKQNKCAYNFRSGLNLPLNIFAKHFLHFSWLFEQYSFFGICYLFTYCTSVGGITRQGPVV